MRIFAPLRHRPVALLWSGQLLSSLGDEVNRVATVWLATRLWGEGAGRLLALHAFSACVGGLVLGPAIDRLPLRRVLVATDALRAAAVLAVPVGVALGLPLAPLLLFAVAVCAALSAAFDPALRALVTVLVPAGPLRGPANALIESTVRFARVLGPVVVASLAGVLATVQLFSLDAGTFALSALSVAGVGRLVSARELDVRPSQKPLDDGPVEEGLRATLRSLWAEPVLRFAVASGAAVTAAWWLLLPLGLELLLAARGPHTVSDLAAVMTAYGAGNLASNLAVGNFADRHPARLLFLGRILAGVGFSLCVFAPTRTLFALAAALAATGGPVTDVGFMGMLQARFAPSELARVYRVNLVLNYGLTCALFFVSPWLFRAGGAPRVSLAAALVIGLCGAWGLARYGRSTEYA